MLLTYYVSIDGEVVSQLNEKYNYTINGDGFSIGDDIKMIFNVKLKTLSFYQNNKYLGIGCDSIDLSIKHYWCAIRMYDYGDSMQLLSFKIKKKSVKYI